jgi:hypothetical protein
MEMQRQKGQNLNEDDVLNFDLDDISLEDIDQQAPGREDEEIIELTDLVARGMPLDEKEMGAAAEPAKEAPPPTEEFELIADDLVGVEPAAEEGEDKKGGAEADVGDFALELDLAEGEKHSAPEEPDTEEIVTNEELEAILKDEEPLELVSDHEEISDENLEKIVSLDPEDGAGQSAPDLPDVIGDADLLKEEKVVPPGVVPPEAPPFIEPEPEPVPFQGFDEVKEEPFEPAAPSAAAEPPMAGISEEKLEAIVTKVVQEVVERVARETMTSVAERMIGEAIESLKKSLSENP